jgi:hypothetical protein
MLLLVPVVGRLPSSRRLAPGSAVVVVLSASTKTAPDAVDLIFVLITRRPVGVLMVLVLTCRPAVVVGLSDVVGLSVVVVVVGSVVVVVLDVVLVVVVLDVVLVVVVLDVVLDVVLLVLVLGFVRPVVAVGFLGVVTLGHVQTAARVAEFPFVPVGDPAVSLAKAAVAETRKAEPTSTLTSPRPSLRRKLPVRPIPHPPRQEPAVELLNAKLIIGSGQA